MLPEGIIERLRCPMCGQTVTATADDGGALCSAGHGYTMRDGYVDCSAGAVAEGSTERTLARPQGFGLRALALRLAAALRTITVRLPHQVLEVVSAPIAVCLFYGVVASGHYGDRHEIARWPGYRWTPRGKPMRSLVLDTFDRLSAPVEHRYIWRELAPWFTSSGLVVDTARDETGWFILADKP